MVLIRRGLGVLDESKPQFVLTMEYQFIVFRERHTLCMSEKLHCPHELKQQYSWLLAHLTFNKIRTYIL